ncbi:HTH-type transcriptional regulator BsdA [Lentibacillus sp. JNUCC-1]|uniref:LysR family transcriptional regulator n=1 Tax=Lentibacillus sp. JNUCC-1 TaxID=2654513 RepID=UPI0012E8723D|nr:LysR family transcriptional regulator [Lentibacillus sp. JNUCC-1]MUV37524.1 HTH-type transcriptional regulator BsdA [Lentibacillus sp. JNUCC-1]
MEIRQIKYFMEVARREHVTEAANALHVAQSAVSRQIAKLEEELGVALFIREGRVVRLTPIGKVFLEQMERAMNRFDDAQRIIEEYTDPERGTIHIGFPSSVAAYILPTALSRFRRDYPNVKFELKQGSYYEIINSVVKGEVNMAMVGPVPADHPKVAGTILFTEKIAALVPAGHHLADRTAVTLNDLRNDPFVMFPEGYVLRDMTEEACRQSGFRPNVSFEGKDMDAIKGLVSAGLGVSLVPEITLIDSLPRATVQVPIKEPDMGRTVGLIVPRDRELLPTEELFHGFAQAFFDRLERFQN